MPKFVEGFADKIVVPAGRRDALVFDEVLPGFGVRKFPSGRAVYVVKYNVGGKQRRQALGEVVRGNLRAMRLLASDVRAQARQGRDVLAEREVERAAIANRKNLGDLIPEYLKSCAARVRPSTLSETTRYLTQSWKPLHNREITSISRSDALAVVDGLESDSGARSADCARAALHGLLAWALDKEFIDANVAAGIKRRATGSSRERVLSDGELCEAWHACLDDDHGRITRLLLLTGARRAEIGDLAWDEIDAAGRQICLPGGRTKNGKGHTIPLSDQALALLPERRDGHEHLFGRLPGAGFSGWSKGKSELDARIAAARKSAGLKRPPVGWVLHDLRRTCATGLQRLGTRLEVIESALNHTSGSRGGIVGVYQRHKFTDEVREALAMWGGHVEKLVR